MFKHKFVPLFLIGLVIALIAACAPVQPAPGGPPPAATTAPAPAESTTAAAATEPAAAATSAPTEEGKTLTIGMSQEPRGFGVMISQIAAIQAEQALNAYWTYRDADLNAQPWLVEKIPSIADGDWVVNDDGTMEVTWTLREGITWSDGEPLTVEDVIFGWQVMTDPDIPAFGKATAQQISEIEKVDDRTFTVHWKQPFVFADQGMPELATTARPLPRHILEEDYNTDKEKFRNNPYWTTEFVGTGPYRITEWVPGSQITMEARPDYFMGAPNIDRLVWRFFPDTNTLMANVLSGDIDVVVNPGLSIDQALTIKEQWDQSGEGEVLAIPGFGWDWIGFNVFENPVFEDVRIRQALLYSIDREEIVQSLFQGLNPVMDTWLAPRHPLLTEEVQAQIIKYPYDPEKAAELFAEAGWTKGPDGILTNADGEKLSVSIRTLAGDKTKEAVQAVVAEYWKQAGLEVELDNQPSQIIYDNAHLFQFGWPSVFLFNYGGNPNVLTGEYRCQDIPTEENNWAGSNLTGICLEEYDTALAEHPMSTELDVAERQAIAGMPNRKSPSCAMVSPASTRPARTRAGSPKCGNGTLPSKPSVEQERHQEDGLSCSPSSS